jgi:hypothetical protein
LRSKREKRRTDIGVKGRLAEEGDLVNASSCSRDGVDMIESLDIDREGNDNGSFSISLSSNSVDVESGISRRKSRGEPLPNEDDALISFLHSSLRCSIETRLDKDADSLKFEERAFGGGITVSASKAATETGNEACSCRGFLPSLRGDIEPLATDDLFFVGIDIGCEVGSL